MKNYYEILEVDKNASDEIIKVSYKALVKKYHPDLKEGTSKINAEDKIKQINEAYDILYNPEKKYEYDQNLINESISKEQYEIIINENINLRRELSIYRNNYNYQSNVKYTQTPNYTNTYTNNTYNQQSQQKNSKSFKDKISERLKTILAICLTFLLLFILYNIPLVKNLFGNYLNTNYIFVLIILIIAYIYFFRDKQ